MASKKRLKRLLAKGAQPCGYLLDIKSLTEMYPVELLL